MILCIDTETTGQEPPEVIELAWVKVKSGVWQSTEDPRVERFSPAKPILWGALATHHILPEELTGKLPSQRAALPAGVDYIIGHNIDYDWGALGKPPGLRRICTLAVARHLFPECDSHSLSALVYRFNPGSVARELVRSAHSAGADVLLCLLVLCQMLKAANLEIPSAEALWKFSEKARIPSTMSFGKFKGQPITSVDRGYALWYSRQPDTDPYLIQALQRAGKL